MTSFRLKIALLFSCFLLKWYVILNTVSRAGILNIHWIFNYSNVELRLSADNYVIGGEMVNKEEEIKYIMYLFFRLGFVLEEEAQQVPRFFCDYQGSFDQLN